MNHLRTPNFLLSIFLIANSVATGVQAQETGSRKAPNPTPPFALKVERNEVPMRVVVQDRVGRPVTNLTRDDFVVLDNGKTQVITQFSIEATEPAGSKPTSAEEPPSAQKAMSVNAQIPDRFVAFYFDDLTLDFAGAVRTREAASKFLANAMRAGDRAAVYTSSGRDDLEFTSDRDKLQQALARIQPNRLFGEKEEGCPELSDYEAYLIDQRHDQVALGVAAQKVINCHCGGNAVTCSEPQRQAKAAARMRWAEVEQQVLYSLRGLAEIVRRLSFLPGERRIIFVSPGFISDSQLNRLDELITRAVQSRVVINCVDSRGLFVPMPGGGVSEPISTMQGKALLDLDQIRREAELRATDVMAGVATGTGGVFFHNNNDLDAGFRVAGGLPKFAYLLTFSPAALKQDGKYHRLTVRLARADRRESLAVLARRGYFAPGGSASLRAGQEEMQNQVFSRLEVNPSRVRVEARASMPGVPQKGMTVQILLKPEWIRFRSEDDRSVGQVKFFTALFDDNGNYVDGTKKELDLRLDPRELAEVQSRGISVLTDFKVPPGEYLIREVVADADGLIASHSQPIAVP